MYYKIIKTFLLIRLSYGKKIIFPLTNGNLDIITNVYAGGYSTKMQVQFENGGWQEMQHDRRIYPTVQQIIQQNRAKTTVQADQLEWLQLSDLKGWDTETVALYSIRGIPQNFLIDPEGKIIDKNLLRQ